MVGRFLVYAFGALVTGLLGVLPMGCPPPPVATDDNPAGVTLARSVDQTFIPGDTVAVTVTINATEGGSISAIGVFETIPEGWSFASASGPPIVPAEGAMNRLDFAWITPPTFPYVFTYHVLTPSDALGDAEIAGSVEYRQGAGPYTTADVTSTVTSSNSAGITLQRTHADTFTPGETFRVMVHINLDTAAMVSAMGLAESIPDGWTLDSISAGSGAVPEVAPSPGSDGPLEFIWINVPDFPYSFTYDLRIPADAAGSAQFVGKIEYREDGGPLSTGNEITAAEAATR